MHIRPNLGALDGTGQLKTIAGALLMIVLIAAVLTVIISGVAWALANAGGNYRAAARGRVGVLVAFGAAVLAGSAVAWLKFLIALGNGL